MGASHQPRQIVDLHAAGFELSGHHVLHRGLDQAADLILAGIVDGAAFQRVRHANASHRDLLLALGDRAGGADIFIRDHERASPPRGFVDALEQAIDRDRRADQVVDAGVDQAAYRFGVRFADGGDNRDERVQADFLAPDALHRPDEIVARNVIVPDQEIDDLVVEGPEQPVGRVAEDDLLDAAVMHRVLDGNGRAGAAIADGDPEPLVARRSRIRFPFHATLFHPPLGRSRRRKMPELTQTHSFV